MAASGLHVVGGRLALVEEGCARGYLGDVRVGRRRCRVPGLGVLVERRAARFHVFDVVRRRRRDLRDRSEIDPIEEGGVPRKRVAALGKKTRGGFDGRPCLSPDRLGIRAELGPLDHDEARVDVVRLLAKLLQSDGEHLRRTSALRRRRLSDDSSARLSDGRETERLMCVCVSFDDCESLGAACNGVGARVCLRAAHPDLARLEGIEEPPGRERGRHADEIVRRVGVVVPDLQHQLAVQVERRRTEQRLEPG